MKDEYCFNCLNCCKVDNWCSIRNDYTDLGASCDFHELNISETTVSKSRLAALRIYNKYKTHSSINDKEGFIYVVSKLIENTYGK